MNKRRHIYRFMLFMLFVVLSNTSYGNEDKDFVVPRQGNINTSACPNVSEQNA